MTEVAGSVSNRFEMWSRAALDEGRLSAFTTAIDRATFFNASPYVLSFDDFTMRFGFSASRALSIKALGDELQALRVAGVNPAVILVGGSFIDREREAPKDLDCLIFYEVENPATAPSVIGVQSRLARAGVDARLFPIDVSPTFTLKVALFFNNLYASRRDGEGELKGCLLVQI